MVERQSKFQPKQYAKLVLLQPRDIELIKALYHFRYLRRDQIQKLFNWNCVTRVNSRLRKLFDSAFLYRTFLPTVKGSSKAIYTLGRNAGQIVSEKLNIPLQEVRSKIGATRKASPLFLSHSLHVSESRIRLDESFKNVSLKVNLWLNDLDCVDHFTYQDGHGRKVTRHFKPDSYCQLIYSGKIYSFFLEVDNGTMGHKRISLKTKVYDEYRNLGLYASRFGLKNFRILFVLNSQMRGKALKSTLENDNRKNIWLVQLEDLTSDAIFQRVWFKTFEPEPIWFLQRDNAGGNQ